jgi:hypothetical protein
MMPVVGSGGVIIKLKGGVSAPVRSNMKGHKMKLPRSLSNKKSGGLVALFLSGITYDVEVMSAK